MEPSHNQEAQKPQQDEDDDFESLLDDCSKGLDK